MMTKQTLNELFEYAVEIRRRLHEYPELGFELDRTVSAVSAEIEKMGVDHTMKYGKSSIVAELGSGEEIIAFRADMDALPIEENSGLSYSSKIKGRMHACGHDAHTAVLLAVVKYLKENERLLKKRIRFLFQPSEECEVSGAKMMIDNGVLEGVSEIIGAHCEPMMDTNNIGFCAGDYMATCVPMTISFFGVSSHATVPEMGIDALAMAVRAYCELEKMIKEEAGERKYIWSVGRMSGGQAHNIIANRCDMNISFRFYDAALERVARERTREICEQIAESYGGRVEIDWNISTPAVHNDGRITEKFVDTLEECGINTVELNAIMTSEDFGQYLSKVRGLLFRFGTKNESEGCDKALHRNDFKMDEEGMKAAIEAFCAYAFSQK